MSCAKALITARPPKCKRCGASAAKPVQSLTITQLRAGPGQPFVPVDKPVDKMPSPQSADALFGVLGLVPVTLEQPKPAKHGKLTILGPTDSTRRGRHVMCRCDCGVEKPVALRLLLAGLTTSCGCGRVERIRNLIAKARVTAAPGRRYGQLVVVREIEPYVAPGNNKSYRRVLCKCDCGRDRTATTNKLNSGDVTCCHGCSPRAKQWDKGALTPAATVAQ
jgi:hypothetical protein